MTNSYSEVYYIIYGVYLKLQLATKCSLTIDYLHRCPVGCLFAAQRSEPSSISSSLKASRYFIWSPSEFIKGGVATP